MTRSRCCAVGWIHGRPNKRGLTPSHQLSLRAAASGPSFTLLPSSLPPPTRTDTRQEKIHMRNTHTHMRAQRKRRCRRSSSLTLAPALIVFPDHFQLRAPVVTSRFPAIHFLSNHTAQSLSQTCAEQSHLQRAGGCSRLHQQEERVF